MTFHTLCRCSKWLSNSFLRLDYFWHFLRKYDVILVIFDVLAKMAKTGPTGLLKDKNHRQTASKKKWTPLFFGIPCDDPPFLGFLKKKFQKSHSPQEEFQKMKKRGSKMVIFQKWPFFGHILGPIFHPKNALFPHHCLPKLRSFFSQKHYRKTWFPFFQKLKKRNIRDQNDVEINFHIFIIFHHFCIQKHVIFHTFSSTLGA